MLISLLFIIALTLGGLPLTYLVSREQTLMWRLAAGNIVGSALLGLILFAAACLFGLSAGVIGASLLITLLPLALFISPYRRGRINNEWASAKGQLQGFGGKRLAGFLYYAFFFLLFWFFFSQAMYELNDGIYTGGSNNLGDLPFHLGAIFGFTDGNNFPPQNPSWAGARFSYPFTADLLTAAFVKVGADVKDAIFLQDVSWAMSLLVIIEQLVRRLTGSKLAGRIAPGLLIFSGGLGFVWFLKDWWTGAGGPWNLAHDYTINNDFRWGNSMVVLFITQRSLLLGMPLTLLVIDWLWRVFTEPAQPEQTEEGRVFSSDAAAVAIGLLAGTLPLIHLHSLAVLFIVTAFLLLIRPRKWRQLILFGGAVCLIAVPELVWSMSGTATESTKFFGLNWGWDKTDEDNFLWFWIKNTGLVIPAIAAGIYLLMSRRRSGRPEKHAADAAAPDHSRDLVLFYLPFVFIFAVCNVAKLAPWEWDNIKLLIYWFALSIPLIALAIVWAWEQRSWLWRTAAAACFVGLIFAGALDVFRTANGQVKIRVFDRDAMVLGDQIKQRTEPSSLFLNAPTYNSAVVLSGRRSLMRYSGHLSSHGIDFGPREDDVKRIYQGGGVSEVLLRKYNIDYVLVSPEETGPLHANEDFFRRYPVIAESGAYRVYKVK